MRGPTPHVFSCPNFIDHNCPFVATQLWPKEMIDWRKIKHSSFAIYGNALRDAAPPIVRHKACPPSQLVVSNGAARNPESDTAATANTSPHHYTIPILELRLESHFFKKNPFSTFVN